MQPIHLVLNDVEKNPQAIKQESELLEAVFALEQLKTGKKNSTEEQSQTQSNALPPLKIPVLSTPSPGAPALFPPIVLPVPETDIPFGLPPKNMSHVNISPLLLSPNMKRKWPVLSQEHHRLLMDSCNLPKPKKKRRKRDEVERTHYCTVAGKVFNYLLGLTGIGCSKSYGSEGALKTHIKLKHASPPYIYTTFTVENPMLARTTVQ
jgi:hypothetical protein